MSKLHLNFAADQRNLTAWNPALGLALLAVGILAIGLFTSDYRQQAEQKINALDRQNALRQQTQHLHTGDPVPLELATQIDHANTIYALLQTPWENTFAALESAREKVPGTIALLSIKVNSAKKEIILTGEAKDFSALSAFTSALSDIPAFQNVTLSNDKLSSGLPPIVVSFDLRLNWLAQAPSHSFRNEHTP